MKHTQTTLPRYFCGSVQGNRIQLVQQDNSIK
jgi:hypothetical protein